MGRPAARSTLAVVTLVASLTGCGGGAASSLPAPAPGSGSATTGTPTTTAPPSAKLDVSALEYQYDAAGPVNLLSGEVTITLHDQGAEPHHGQLLRLHDGVTDDDIAAAVADDPSAAPLLDLGDHEVTFLALPAGRGREAIEPYLNSLRSSTLLQRPPALTPSGGVAAISPGQTAVVPVDLKPGGYLAICLVRGTNGEAHALHGMVQLFTVR